MNNNITRIMLFVSVLVIAGCKQQVQSLDVGHLISCATNNNNVTCWDPYREKILGYHKLNSPKVAVGSLHYCILDEGNVKCFLDNSRGQTNVPQLSNPYEIAAGFHHTCALDDTGLVCWGDGPLLSGTKILSNPRNLVSGWTHVCLLDDEGVYCDGFNYVSTGNPSPPEHHSNITQLSGSSSSQFICGKQDQEWGCWGGGYFYQAPATQNVPEIVMPGFNGISFCAIDSGTLTCTGGDNQMFSPNPVPADITDVSQVGLGLHFTCAVTRKGVKCWTQGGIAWVPPYL